MGKILVADDERGILDVLERVFERRGHEVETFADGASACEALEAGSYDLVVTDLRMPGKTGFEVLAAAKARRPGLPVIVVSGCTDPEDRARCETLGVYTMLHKPVDLAYLLTIAESAMQEEGKTLAGGAKRAGATSTSTSTSTSTAAGVEVRVVERDACTANLLAWCLRKQGYRVGGERPAVVIVGGREGVEAARKDAPRAVLIALHAAGDPAEAVAVLDAGADVALARPFEPDVLFAHVRAAARRAGAAPEAPAKADDKPITRNRLAAVRN